MKRVEKLNKLLYENYEKLSSASQKEMLAIKKYDELNQLKKKYSKSDILELKQELFNFDDLKSFMKNKGNNNIEIVCCNKKKIKNLSEELDFTDATTKWITLRKFDSSLWYNPNPGRNVKFFIKINKKIAGLISLSSDFSSLGPRDEYIGWNRDLKFKKHKLNNIAICSTIIPTQPLGYLTCGGKLLSLLLYHIGVRQLWEAVYNDELVGLTTTALYGIFSQYSGMPKYWKTLGTTEGQIYLYPQERTWRKLIKYLKDNCIEEYREVQEDTFPKASVMQLYFKKSGFKDYWCKKTDKKKFNFTSKYKKGIYFAEFYENTNNFLCDKIDSDEFVRRQTLNFDIENIDEIVGYWRDKFADRRFKKKLPEYSEERNNAFMEYIYDVDNFEEFKEEFLR